MNMDNILKQNIPWITKEIYKKCKIKQKLYTNYKLTNNDNDFLEYKLFKNCLTTLICNTKITFYSEKLKNSSDSKILGIF